MILFKTHIATRRGLLLTCFLLISILAQAKVDKPYTIVFSDSLYADQNTRFLYNNISIKNNTEDSLQIQVQLDCPTQWSLVSEKTQILTFLPNEEKIIPITIIKKQSTAALWQYFKVYITNTNNQSTDTFRFSIGAQSTSSFIVSEPVPITELKKDRTIGTTFQLKNVGNVTGQYIVTLQNEDLELNYRSIIKLAPSKDTTCTLLYTMPKSAWYKFKSETILFTVYDSVFIKKQIQHRDRNIRANNDNINNNNPYTSTFEVSRQDSIFQEHSSPYRDMNIDLESGALSSYNRLSYFFGFKSFMPLSDNSSLRITYRSRQLGLYNIIAKDVYNIYFDSKKWRIHAGQVNDSRYFRSYGNGLSITYRFNDNTELTAFGVIHRPGFFTTSDNAGINVKYRISKIKISQDLIYNTDSGSRINNYLLNNDVDIVRTKTTTISLNGGFGIQQNVLHKTTEPENTSGGYAGYKIQYKLTDWMLSSQFRYYNKNFPGINKGAISQNHSVRYTWAKQKLSTEVYYQYDYRINNYFRDTIYNTDLLSYNTSRYGVRFTKNFQTGILSLGGGYLQQKGQSSYALAPRYQFAELLYNYKSRKRFAMSLSSTVGFANVEGGTAYITSTNASANIGFLGINCGYSSVPNFEYKNQQERILKGKTETVYGGPYVSFKLTKELHFGAQYTVSKTLYDERINSFAGINIDYSNDRKGIYCTVNSSSPLQKTDGSNANPLQYGYLNVVIRKTLKVPFFLKRKYHNIKANVFEDENGNGKLDDAEKPIKGVTFFVKDANFITNQQGAILYKNVDTGQYALDFVNTSVVGFMPVNGLAQTIDVRGNVSKDIPFKKSRIVKGHIDIIQDTLTEKFSKNNIKVTATDSAGRYYTTVTNAEGDYFLNLPAGIYEVSLNPEVFNGNFQAVTISFYIDLNKVENETVNFEIKQRKRQIKLIKTDENDVIHIKAKSFNESKSPDQEKPKRLNNQK